MGRVLRGGTGGRSGRGWEGEGGPCGVGPVSLLRAEQVALLGGLRRRLTVSLGERFVGRGANSYSRKKKKAEAAASQGSGSLPDRGSVLSPQL